MVEEARDRPIGSVSVVEKGLRQSTVTRAAVYSPAVGAVFSAKRQQKGFGHRQQCPPKHRRSSRHQASHAGAQTGSVSSTSCRSPKLKVAWDIPKPQTLTAMA